MTIDVLRLSFFLLSFTLFTQSCQNKADKTRLLLEALSTSTTDSTVFSANPDITRELLINGAFVPTSFPSFIDTADISHTYYLAWAKNNNDQRIDYAKISDKSQVSNSVQHLSSLAILQLHEEGIREEALHILQNQDFETNSLIEKYTYLKLLVSTSIAFSNQYDFQNTLASIFYGLHLIETSPEKHLFINIENQFLESFAEIVTNETIQYSDLIPTAISKLKKNHSKLGNHDMNNFLNLLFLEEDKVDAESIMDLNLSNNYKERMLTHLGFLEFGKEPEKALQLFSRSLALTTPDTYIEKILHVYNAYCYLDLNDYDNVKFELNLAKQHHKLQINSQRALNFLIQRIHLELLAKTQNCNNVFLENLKLRELAKIAFYGHKSLHLEDFYSQNTIEIIKLLERCKINISSRSDDIMNLFYESKIRTENNMLGIHFSDNLHGNKDLMKVQNFQSFDKLSDPVYERLFKHSIQEYLHGSTISKPLDSLSQNITQTDSTIVNFIAYSEDYGVYVKNGDAFHLKRIPRLAVDSLISSLISDIKQNQVNPKLITEISSLFPFIGELSDDQTIFIVPDGLLSTLPLEVIFPRKRFRYLKSINQLDSPVSIIVAKNGTVLSYSDTITLSSRLPKKIPELAQAFEEATMIHQITDAKIVSGYDLTKKQFDKSLSSSFLHIATHGESSMTNRLENYLLMRNNDEIDTLYSFEIADFSSSPAVVILSSCSTGSGEFQQGSGIFSIANALRKTGTKDILKTLWSIDDQHTRIFMENMYTYWSSGETLYNAVQRTKQEFRLECKPFKYWAGFVLEGSGNVYIQ